MKIKDELVLQGMIQEASDKIEYNTMGAYKTSDCNTHGYYIVKWTGNAYNLQEKYKCHAFDPPVIITVFLYWVCVEKLSKNLVT